MEQLIQQGKVVVVIFHQLRRTSMQLNKLWMAVAAGIAISSGGAQAQELFAYPPQSRAKAQQQQDQFECHQWAVEQTHFDPVQYAAQTATGQSTTAPAATAANPSSGPGPRQGAMLASGAATGAAVAKVAGGNPGEGAAAGAVLRTLQGRMGAARAAEEQRQREAQATRQAQLQQAQTQQAQQQEMQARRKAYQQARATCFKARGYTVSEG